MEQSEESGVEDKEWSRRERGFRINQSKNNGIE